MESTQALSDHGGGGGGARALLVERYSLPRTFY